MGLAKGPVWETAPPAASSAPNDASSAVRTGPLLESQWQLCRVRGSRRIWYTYWTGEGGLTHGGRSALRGVGTMPDDAGKMPEQYIDRHESPSVQLKVKDLKPEHGEGFIGVGDVAVDVNRACWVLLDAP